MTGYILGHRRGGAVRRNFLTLCMFVLVSLLLQWMTLIPTIASGLELVLFRLQVACWLSAGMVFLWFAAALVSRPPDRWSIGLSILALVNAFIGSSSDLVLLGYKTVPGGLAIVTNNVNEAILVAVAVLPAALGVFWLERQRRSLIAPERRALLVAAQLAAAISASLIIVIDVALPWSGIVDDLPRGSAIALSLGIMVAYSAVKRHNLLVVTLKSAAMPLYERLGDGVLLLDTLGRVRWANTAARGLLSTDNREPVGESVEELLSVSLPQTEFAGRLFAVGSPEQPRHLSVTQWPNEPMGVPLGRVMLIVDATERVQTQALARRSLDEMEREVERRTAELMAAQRLDAARSLSRGVAHVLNNLLAVILGLGEAVRDIIGATPGVSDDMDELLRAVDRAKEIVKQIGPVATEGEGRHIINLTLLAKQVWRDATLNLEPGVKKRFSQGSDSLVLGDATQLHQVLYNLIKNAREAMAGRSGQLGLHLSEISLSPGADLPSPDLVPGRFARVDVRDEGCGISAEALGAVFEPLFTTKAAGQGTGLGLFNARRIATDHGGALAAQSQETLGSCFTLFLPLAAEASVVQGPLPALAFLGGTERVMLVDDEPLVAGATARLLAPLGYRVEIENNPVLALKRLTGGEQIDILIVDQVMPGMTGTELIEALREAGSVRTPVVLLSGTTDTALGIEAQRLGVRAVLRKPVSRVALGRVLREELDR